MIIPGSLPFRIRSTGTSTCTATKSGIEGNTAFITSVIVVGDTNGGTLTLKTGGSTTMASLPAGNASFILDFGEGLPGDADQNVQAIISGQTSACSVTMCGFIVPVQDTLTS